MQLHFSATNTPSTERTEKGSKFTWNLFPPVGVDLHECVQLGFGYRALGIDYASGEGLGRFEYDMIVSGPVIGLLVRF